MKIGLFCTTPMVALTRAVGRKRAMEMLLTGCMVGPNYQRPPAPLEDAWIDAAIEMIKPGVSTDQVARLWPAAQEIGLPDEKTAFGLLFGHGLGLALHERPIISRLTSLDAPMEIKEGMVFALETYCPATDGRSAARIEEEVVVGPAGIEILTKFPAQELYVTNPY